MAYFRLLITGWFFILSFIVSAQWEPKLFNSQDTRISLVNYVHSNLAYGHNQKNLIYKTEDNWATFTTYIGKLDPNQEAVYFKMKDKVHGVIVSRSNRMLFEDSCFVYITSNGGYDWDVVYKTPIPKASRDWGIDSEPLYVEELSDKLYVLFGDLVSHGYIDGSNWKSSRITRSREINNSQFRVFTDSVWMFQNRSNFWYTQDAGNYWKNIGGYTQFTLGGDHLAVYNNTIIRFTKGNYEWEVVATHDMNLDLEAVLELSENYVLINYYDWRTSGQQHVVFDYKRNRFIELNGNSTFFDLAGYSNEKPWTVIDSVFVEYSKSYYGTLRQTTDFGVTWETIYQAERNETPIIEAINFDKNIGLAGGTSSEILYYTLDYGETWQEATLQELGIGTENYVDINYDIGSDVFVTTDQGTYHAYDNQGSIDFDKVLVELNGAPLTLLDITNIEETYCTAMDAAKVYLLQWVNDTWQVLYEYDRSEFRNERIQDKMIQNDEYVVFQTYRTAHIYDKNTKQVSHITDGLFNTPHDILFLGSDSVFFSSLNGRHYYDIVSSNFDTTFWELEVSGDLKGMESIAQGANGTMKICNRGMIYETSDLVNFIQDETMYHYDGYLKLVYANGSYWCGGGYNLYQEKITDTRSEANFIKIESIFPNPTADQLNVCFQLEEETEVQFEIYTYGGESVSEYAERYRNGIHLYSQDLGRYSPGLYFLRIITSNAVSTYKILVE